MKTEMISTRIEHDTKIQFVNVCDEIGLSPSQAIKLFAKAMINYGGIPFELKIKHPNNLTLLAMAELEQGNGNNTKNIASLMNELDVDLNDA